MTRNLYMAIVLSITINMNKLKKLLIEKQYNYLRVFKFSNSKRNKAE